MSTCNCSLFFFLPGQNFKFNLFNISNYNYIKFTFLLTELQSHVCLILHELNKLKDPNTTKNVKEDICKGVNMAQSFLELYKYQSPMEKQLSKLTEQITEKEEQIKTLKCEIEWNHLVEILCHIWI